MTTEDGCISDFKNGDVINCTLGDQAATRTIALAGGSHAEHWITALDTLGKQHHFKVVTYLKMGCPLSTEKVPLIMGNNAALPAVPHVGAEDDGQAGRRPPRLRLHHRRRGRGTSNPATSCREPTPGSGRRSPTTIFPSWRCGTRRGWCEDGKPFIPADCLADGGNAISCGIGALRCARRPQPDAGFRRHGSRG